MNLFAGLVLMWSNLAGTTSFTAANTPVSVCYQGHTYRIPASHLAEALKLGATRGICK